MKERVDPWWQVYSWDLISIWSVDFHSVSSIYPVSPSMWPLWVLGPLPSSGSSGQHMGPWPGPTLYWALQDALPQALPA